MSTVNILLTLTFVILVTEQGYCLSTEQPDNCMCAEWEQWTEYGPCTAHCGGGRKSRSRVRQCNDINLNLEKSQPFICIKNVTQYQICNTQECGCEAICSSWSDWNEGVCSLKCGGGTLTATRVRQCQGSIGCLEKEQVAKNCHTQPCTGCSCNLWSEWSEYGPCSKDCGNGEQRRNRTRECFPRFQCVDALVEHASSHCNLGVCCEDACTPWSHWKEKSCSETCDYGITSRTRARICALTSCDDREEGIGQCKRHTCPDTCDSTCTSWGSWTTYPCTKSCGGGTRVRKRTRVCTFPDCLEDDIHSATCNNFQCVHCDDMFICSVWSNWKDSKCSKTCDVGILNRTRSRICSIPGCDLEDSHIEVCKDETCEATCDVSCTAWSKWNDGKCSHKCGDGTRIQSRNRTCPYKDCKIKEETTLSCNLKICPAICSSKYCSLWSGWKSSNYCPVTCGGGTLKWTRVRQCDHLDCQQLETTTSPCNTQNCNEKCEFICSQWSDWLHGDCSVSCGEGVRPKKRTRSCTSADCEVIDQQLDSCSSVTCPRSCNKNCTTWSEWEQQGNCSAICGNGTTVMKRNRTCLNSDCMEEEEEDTIVENCTKTCADNCSDMCSTWSQWHGDKWGNGTMVTTRNRTCTQPNCMTDDTKIQNCSNSECSDHIICDIHCEDWSEWIEGPCSSTCDAGTKTRRRERKCDQEEDECVLFQTNQSGCQNTSCSATCNSICTQWTNWFDDACSVSCGLGTKHRIRTRRCPQKDCSESNVIMAPCEEMSCYNIQYDQESTQVTSNSNVCQQTSRMYHPHPTDCTMFIQCSNGHGVTMHCPDTTGWNVDINACVHKWNIPGCT